MDIVAETEQALIGAILQAPEKLVKVLDTVRAEDFASPVAQKVFITAVSLWKQKKTVDLVSVASVDPTTATYLAESTSKGASIGIVDYAWQVSKAAKERRVAETLLAVINGREPIESKLDTLLSLYQREMFVNKKSPDIGQVLERFSHLQTRNRQTRRLGFPTGFPFLEEKYIQYIPGHIWMMGAFTSVGKTAMMVQKICNLLILDDSPSMVVISSEMTEEQLVSRILANFTGVHSYRILSGNFRQGEEEIVEEYKGLINGKQLKIYDDIYTIGDIETVFRKADLQGGVDVGWIDYVQNCSVPEAQSAYQEGAIMAKRLQQMAKDVRCTLICLSQVSNSVGRGDSDQLEYKGAGEWAAVADVGVFLQRSKKDKYKLRYKVDKNRHGPTVVQDFSYMTDYTRLETIKTEE